MSVEGGIPALSIPRSEGSPCSTRAGSISRRASRARRSCLPASRSGQTGDRVNLSSFFDGWGYVHLYRNNPGKLVELDRFAIPEAMNPAYATGFGDLSVHEVAVSPTRNDLAYFSYYSAGFRVLKIVDDRARRGRTLHRPARKQLLGRAGLPPRRAGIRRRERHGPRAVHLQVHRQRVSPSGWAAAAAPRPT